jgi:hypothetical protein
MADRKENKGLGCIPQEWPIRKQLLVPLSMVSFLAGAQCVHAVEDVIIALVQLLPRCFEPVVIVCFGVQLRSSAAWLLATLLDSGTEQFISDSQWLHRRFHRDSAKDTSSTALTNQVTVRPVRFDLTSCCPPLGRTICYKRRTTAQAALRSTLSATR